MNTQNGLSHTAGNAGKNTLSLCISRIGKNWKNMPKFSICTPTIYTRDDEDNKIQPRYEMFLRCKNSVLSQTFKDFQWVVVDDQSQPPVSEEVMDMENVKVVRLDEKLGRIAARNAGMKAADGDWITWLDADDEYSSLYLEAIDKAIKLYPDYLAFNMNHLVFSYDFGVSVRKFLDFEKLEGRPFGSGTVGAGSYVFHRSVYEEIGPMPELGLWDFATKMREEYPEIAPFFWNETNKDYNSLGNPWGEDYYYFYKIYKKFKVKYLDTALYFVHSHYGHRFKEDPEYELGDDAKPIWRPKIT